MPEREIEGVNVDVTGNKKMEHSYDPSDIEALYRRGDWESWGEIIQWLDTQGESDNEFTPGEVIAMAEDLRQLQRRGIDFTADPHRAYDLVFKYGVGTGSKRAA